MSDKSKIKIVSKLAPEFVSSVVIDNVKYHVQTEDMGQKKAKIVTNIYLKGEIVFSKAVSYASLVNDPESQVKIALLMKNHHKKCTDLFIAGKIRKTKQKSELLSEMKQALRKGNGTSALETMKEAIELYPEDPFFQSYYGCLISVVEKKHREGIRVCRDAIKLLERTVPFGPELFYPQFYLNLGRASFPVNKKEAYRSFSTGLQHDPENPELIAELRKMGSRREPPVPFLKRSNPLNKYIGMLINRMTKP